MTGFETKKQMESKGKDGKMAWFPFKKVCPICPITIGDMLWELEDGNLGTFGARIKVSKIESYGSSQRHLCFCPESAALTIRIKNVQTIVWISGIWPCLMKSREFETLSSLSDI